MATRILADRYEVIAKIGDGGMAVVYKAKDKRLNRMVAIKVLRPEFVRDESFVESFKRESYAAARIQHPNIVSVYDVGKEGNIYFIVMELVEGRTLSNIIEEDGPIDFKTTIKIAKQVASALSLAHKNHIVHRDIKPHNILVSTDGLAKITDFGIARAVSDGTIVSDAGTIMGSVHYFSPEQSRGGYVDEKTDIYSLGIVIYEMLTGEVPFDAENALAIAMMHMKNEINPPSSLVDGVPPGLDQIVLKATEKYQTDRFKSIDEMYDALNNVNFITGMIEDADVLRYTRRDTNAPKEIREDDITPAAVITRDPKRGGRKASDEASDDAGKMVKNGNNDKPRKSSRKPFLATTRSKIIAGAVAIFVLAAAVLGSYLLFFKTKDISTPNFLGKTMSEAKKLAEEKGVKLDRGEDISSDDYEKGKIAFQDPGKGAKVKKGRTIVVNVSSGKNENTVPDIIGRSKKDATKILKQAGYKVGDIIYKDSEKEYDTVIGQDPEAGSMLSRGSKIDLILSQGKQNKEVAVPKIVGMDVNAAKQTLESMGLVLGEIKEEYSNAYVAGQIMYQNPGSGSTVNEGQKIDVTISKGSQDKSWTITIPVDRATTDVFTMTVVQILSDGSQKNIIKDKTCSKSEGAQKVSVAGTGIGRIIVYFNGTQAIRYELNYATGDLNEV